MEDNIVVDNITGELNDNSNNNFESCVDKAYHTISIADQNKISSSISETNGQLFPARAMRDAIEDEMNFARVLKGNVHGLKPDFLAVPQTRVEIDLKHELYTDYTLFVRKMKGTKVGVTLCRCDGDICLYSVNASLLNIWGEDTIKTVKAGDILRGINNEFFPRETPVDQVSSVLSYSGPNISLHLRRINFTSTEYFKLHSCEHILVKMIADSYKGTPISLGYGLTDSLQLILRRSLQWSTSYIIQKVSNKILYKMSSSVFSESEVLGRPRNWSKSTYDFMSPYNSKECSRSQAIDQADLTTRNSPVSLPFYNLNSSISRSKNATGISDIQSPAMKELWSQNIKINVCQLRPAISFRILKIIQHRNGDVEYVICVTDVQTGSQWNICKKYKDFGDLKTVSRKCDILMLMFSTLK